MDKFPARTKSLMSDITSPMGEKAEEAFLMVTRSWDDSWLGMSGRMIGTASTNEGNVDKP